MTKTGIVKGIQWMTQRINITGTDSHAKASRELMMLLGLPEDETEPNPDKPVQFRAAIWRQWVGKGTVAYNPALDGSGYDLVIPLSSLKRNKPALGNYQGKILMGLVFEAEVRNRAKPGWMLFQWFDFSKIKTILLASCKKNASDFTAPTTVLQTWLIS